MNPRSATENPPEPARARRARRRSWRSLSVTLPADSPELLALIRRLVRANLLDCGADPAKAGDVELCVSELLTNAQRYSPGPARLELSLHHGAVHLEVSDTSTAPPNASSPDLEGQRENGKGLHIVKALAYAVGVRTHPWGKTVKASIDLT